MDAARRIHRQTLPTVSGQTLSGVTALVAVLGFATSALPSLLIEADPLGAAGGAHPSQPRSSKEMPTISPVVDERSELRPLTQPAVPGHEPDNLAPLVEQVRFEREVITSSCDLRLRIHASDPDGDPLALRTVWTVDGEKLETKEPVLARSRFSRGSRVKASVFASDRQSESPAFTTPEIVVSNAAPRITTFPSGFDATGSFVYPVAAFDADGDTDLAFRLLDGPRGMRLDAREGVVTWIPAANQTGTHVVHIQVQDAHGGRQSQFFEVQARMRRARSPAPAAHALSP